MSIEMQCSIAPADARLLAKRIKRLVGRNDDDVGIRVEATDDGAVRLAYSNRYSRNPSMKKLQVSECLTAASVECAGVSSVPARKFALVCGKAGKRPIGIESDGADADRATLRNGTMSMRLDRPECAPDFEGGDNLAAIEVEGARFLDALRRTMPFTSKEETRFYLRGGYVHLREGALRICATDGRRLGLCSVPLIDPDAAFAEGALRLSEIRTPITDEEAKDSMSSQECGAFILDAAHMQFLIDLIEDHAPETLVVCPPKKSDLPFCVYCDSFTFEGEPINGSFPTYGRVYPTEFTRKATARAVDVHDTTKDILDTMESGGRAIKITLGAERMGLEMTMPGSGAHMADSVPITRTEGEDLECGFNGKYFLQCVSTCGDCTAAARKVAPEDAEPDVEICFESANAPALLRPLDNPDWSVVVMPMRA